MQCIVVGNILDLDSFNRLEATCVLPDTAYGNSETIVEGAILDGDVG